MRLLLPDAQTGVILGAGFSAAMGMPAQKALPERLLEDGLEAFEPAITEVIRGFLRIAFNYSSGPLPSLEDIFTMIDLSANSGHHLGHVLAPKHLRAVRRMLIYRIFSILDKAAVSMAPEPRERPIVPSRQASSSRPADHDSLCRVELGHHARKGA